MIKIKIYTALIVACASCIFGYAQQIMHTKVLVIGGGTGGTAAGIQSARLGVSTIIAEPTNWLGGMLSAAGVSAVDGNHNLPSGIWREFRDKVYKVYGGVDKVATGWVSNTQFEPHVADSIFKEMAAAEKKLTVLYDWVLIKTISNGNTLTGAIFTNTKNEKLQINAIVIIDATDLGDVMAVAQVPHNFGMEASSLSGENVGVTATNTIIQDLTYVAILKDFGAKADCTIIKPHGYNPLEFDGACTNYYINKYNPAPTVNAQKMLDYGKLPNNKYMLNWPNNGNDTYVNMVQMSAAERAVAAEVAKQTTLRFIYFIQQQLGFKNLGLATDEFTSSDRLALIPYHREGRRVKGLVRLTVNEIANPFKGLPFFRTGIAVGDYPIDHHHKKNPAAPQHLDFYPVPSYNIPLGALIPASTEGLIIAEKGISVSNVANGTTRLQPCVLLTGQAAGVLAALSILQKKQPRQISIRAVQSYLLGGGAYIMPYIDVPFDDAHFIAIQKIGATGILRGNGIPYQWANQTWFYPDSMVVTTDLLLHLKPFAALKGFKNKYLTVNDAIKLAFIIAGFYPQKTTANALSYSNINRLTVQTGKMWTNWKLSNFDTTRNITRAELAVLLDKTIDPFRLLEPDFKGTIHR